MNEHNKAERNNALDALRSIAIFLSFPRSSVGTQPKTLLRRAAGATPNCVPTLERGNDSKSPTINQRQPIESDPIAMMTFPDNLGVITCRCVLEARKPVLFVSHASGDWQMYCTDANHDFEDEVAMKNELVVVHVAHLLAQDATLNDITDLPVDMGAERLHVGGSWTRFENADDE